MGESQIGDVSAVGLVELLQAALEARGREGRRGLVQVMATAPATVARVEPLDDLGDVAASLNRLGAGEVVYVDRWAAAARLGRVPRQV